jgi:hypothetical protein
MHLRQLPLQLFDTPRLQVQLLRGLQKIFHHLTIRPPACTIGHGSERKLHAARAAAAAQENKAGPSHPRSLQSPGFFTTLAHEALTAAKTWLAAVPTLRGHILRSSRPLAAPRLARLHSDQAGFWKMHHLPPAGQERARAQLFKAQIFCVAHWGMLCAGVPLSLCSRVCCTWSSACRTCCVVRPRRSRLAHTQLAAVGGAVHCPWRLALPWLTTTNYYANLQEWGTAGSRRRASW